MRGAVGRRGGVPGAWLQEEQGGGVCGCLSAKQYGRTLSNVRIRNI